MRGGEKHDATEGCGDILQWYKYRRMVNVYEEQRADDQVRQRRLDRTNAERRPRQGHFFRRCIVEVDFVGLGLGLART